MKRGAIGHVTPGEFSVAVFPFLKTSKLVALGSLRFRSTEDTGDLHPDQALAVAEIAEMLYLKDDLRLKSASYAIIPRADFSRGTMPDLGNLQDAQAVVAYLYAAPHPTSGDLFLSSEHSSLVVFSPSQVAIHLVHPSFHWRRAASSSSGHPFVGFLESTWEPRIPVNPRLNPRFNLWRSTN